MLAHQSVTMVAREIGVSRRTVLRWKSAPRPRRGAGPGRPRTWTEEHLKTFRLRVNRMAPDECTTERLVEVLQRITGHERSSAAAVKLLRRAGLRLIRAGRRGDGVVARGSWQPAEQRSPR
jgi:transposase